MLKYPWAEMRAPDGTPYYWNQEENITSWEFPDQEGSEISEEVDEQYSNSQSFYDAPPNDGNYYGDYGYQEQNYQQQRRPTTFVPNEELKTAGSHSSVSLPTGVVVTSLRYQDVMNYNWDSMRARNRLGDKSGYLERLKGTTWYTQFFVLKNGILFWYKEQLAPKAEGEIPLKGALVEENKKIKRPFSIHIFLQEEKRHYCLVADKQDDFDSWLAALQAASVGDMPTRRPFQTMNGYDKSATYAGYKRTESRQFDGNIQRSNTTRSLTTNPNNPNNESFYNTPNSQEESPNTSGYYDTPSPNTTRPYGSTYGSNTMRPYGSTYGNQSSMRTTNASFYGNQNQDNRTMRSNTTMKKAEPFGQRDNNLRRAYQTYNGYTNKESTVDRSTSMRSKLETIEPHESFYMDNTPQEVESTQEMYEQPPIEQEMTQSSSKLANKLSQMNLKALDKDVAELNRGTLDIPDRDIPSLASADWEEFQTEEGETYYWNRVTNETSWEMPT